MGTPSDQWFRDLLEAAPDAIVGIDAEGRIVLVNARTEELFGWGRAALLGEPVEILLPERVRAAHVQHRDGYVAAPRTRPMGVGLSVSGRRRDGTEFPVEISLGPFQTPEGVIVTGIVRDVSARRSAEEKLRGLLESAPDAMVIVDRGGRIVLVNSQVERLFGYRRDEILGQPVEILVPEAFRPGHAGHRTAYFEAPQPHAMGSRRELVGRRRDGSEFPAEISLSPLETEEGLLVTSIIRDVSERQALMRERANAEAANRAKDEFLSVLSHELRTPLTPILAWTRILRRGGAAAERVAQGLAVIERSAQAQARLVEDLLDVSRIVSGKLQLDRQPVELRDVIQAAIESMRPAADAKSLRLEVLADPGAGFVLGDVRRLQQVVWNLLGNAIKFSAAGGAVRIRLADQGSHAEVTVTDAGEGIGAEFVPYLFERFRQADSSSTRVHGGLGLGLAIVRHLVEQHGGTVEGASPGAGRGATFTVRLPVFTGSRAGVSAVGAAAAGADNPRLEGLRILIVENDRETRDVLMVLVADCGAETRTVVSAEEALDVVQRWPIDLLLSDLGLPGANGYTFIEAIRRGERDRVAKPVPAIAITAYARREDEERALAAGFTRFVAKPLDPAALLVVVADLVGRGP